MYTNKLLHLIEKDATLSNKDLAAMLGEELGDVESKINELENKKIICGKHTLINWDKTNQQNVRALIEVNCSPEREYGYDKIAKKIYMFEEVDSVSLLSGSSGEFMVTIEGKTMQEIAYFVGNKLAPIVGVTGTSTLFILKDYKKNGVIMADENSDDEERLLVTP